MQQEQTTKIGNGYLLTTEKSLMNKHDIYKWLSEESYWCKGVPYEIFSISFDNSFCIGVLEGTQQIAFARLITDYATFGYLADVFVRESYRGQGLSKAMLQLLFELGWVKSLRGIKLQTSDAQGLYHKFGFGQCKYPERIMEISRPAIYAAPHDNETNK